MEVIANFADRLSELMDEKSISGDQLGKIINVDGSTVRLWREGKSNLSLSNMIRLADHFNCSIEFLLGKTDTLLDYSPQQSPLFYARLREVMAEKGVSRYRIVKNTRISDGFFWSWSKGTDPNIQSIIELADYLDVTVDYLVGRDK